VFFGHALCPGSRRSEADFSFWPQAFISIEELVGTTLFLTSNAARNITGQSIALDGGWTSR
jgi:NAD(P)-dependent dehydrogenase (short-subunit alcohol dehydrogenase family)